MEATQVVDAVLDRTKKPEPNQAFWIRTLANSRVQAKAAAKATGSEFVTERHHVKPVPLAARLNLEEPVPAWSGLGMGYLGAMIGGLIQEGRPLPVVLDALCRVFDATVEGYFSCVLLLDRTRTRVRHAVGPGLPSSYKELLEGRLVSDVEGPAAVTANQKTPVVASYGSLAPQPDRNGCPAFDLAHGVKSWWSSPLFSLTGESLGIFAIYQRASARVRPLHPALIQKFTHVASIVIERTRNDEMLKRSEALLAKAQRLSATGTFSWRVTTDEITWSEELYRIFALDSAIPVTLELIGTRVHAEDAPLFHHMIDRVRGGVSGFECEHRLQMPDHSVKYLHVVADRTRDQDGELEYIGAIRDVTERRLSENAVGKLRSELAHVARVTSLGALTASIAHEVNQPLLGIMTNASTCLRMLATVPPDLDGACETARRTIRDANRASEVVTRLRALFAKKHATTEAVDLNEATRGVIELLSNELQRSRVILRTELANGLSPVTGDRVQLQQVILNLLLNASEAMSGVDDRPRQLRVRTERDEGDFVRLTVQDAGVGFEPQDMERLFEPFYTTKSGGMGIGLSVSRSIIESHHGRLWAAPNNGPGATFSFSVPLQREGMTGSHKLGATGRSPVTGSAHLTRTL